MKKFINKIMALGVITGLLLESFPVYALEKEETIYAKLEGNGQVSEVIVSEHLKETYENETEDKTKLENIKNINGNEKFTLENGRLVWSSTGKDIYYQGNTTLELPISLNISYYLNGEEKTVKEMLGKSGQVKIVLKYTNNDRRTSIINGKATTLYAPFVIATSTILSNSTNKNINVTNGKVITNGESSVVVMLSTPGLYESLGISQLKGMDQATITYDTDSFSLSSIYSIATPKVIESSDLQVFDKMDGIFNSVNTLISSSNKIQDGSKQLLEGANTLSDGVTKLADGVNTVYQGSNSITEAVQLAINNAKEDNSPAISQEKLAEIKEQSVLGAKQVIDIKADEIGNAASNAANSSISEQLSSIGNSAQALAKQEIDSKADQIGNTASNNALQTINQQLDAIGSQASNTAQSMITEDSINQIKQGIVNGAKQTLTDEFDNQVAQKALEALNQNATYTELKNKRSQIPASELQRLATACQEQVIANEDKDACFLLKSIKIMEDTAKATAVATARQTVTSTAQNIADQTVTQVIPNVVNEIASNTAKETAKTIAQNVASETAKNTAQTIAQQVANSTAQKTAQQVAQETARETAKSTAYQVAEDVAGKVSTSVAIEVANKAKETATSETIAKLTPLFSGLKQLTDGLNEMNQKVSLLDNGAQELTNGIGTLNSGIELFNTQGINKINSLVNGDIKTIKDKLSELAKISANYKTFDDIPDNADGSSKIIMVVNAVEAPSNTINPTDKIVIEVESLWDKIKKNQNKKEL